MEILSRTEDDAIVIGVEGEIDLQHSGNLREILLRALVSHNRIIVDMTEVTLIDSSGVASLLEAFQEATKSGKIFILAEVSNTVMQVLTLAHLEQLFSISATVDEALKA
jgi:anti-sigma B factor antagonist